MNNRQLVIRTAARLLTGSIIVCLPAAAAIALHAAFGLPML